jgi:thiol-disulfide isomerase/thioredoxin
MSLINKPLLIGVLALSVATLSAFAGGKGIKVGDSFPDLGDFGLEGKLPENVKGKVVLVDFWASWCEPCKESFPAMEELHQKYSQKGLVILAVNVDENVSAMKDFLKDHRASFTIVHDASKKLVGTVNISSMPSSLIIGPDGKVASIHKGFHGKKTSEEYAKEIEGLLSARVASR